ncbi:MAG TPA: TIGR01212 family radical SAM protein [Bacillota bacterium]|nr:TIGR01212 family radical SAM protein [Bacillota bacterium]HPJ85751.1 TIGR01212 family radical SAM protein [Bacillota bacterium]
MDFVKKEKPYLTANDFYRARFGHKIAKIPLNGGFTCPNRDGTLSWDGCIFCSEKGSGDFAGDPGESLGVQYARSLEVLHKKWPGCLTIPYFQANTNTYAPLSRLKKLYEEAINLSDEVVGLSIATRPDVLPDDVVEYLGELRQRTFLTVELGLQSIHASTASFINRQHSLESFVDAVAKLRKKDIHVICHIINGLPGETPDMMLDTIRFLNKQDIQGIKIHMLYVMKNTRLADLYEKGEITMMSRSDYIETTADQIELLRPDIIIYRLTGDSPRKELVAPLWSLKKFTVTNDIDKLLRKRHSHQGARYEG